MLSYLSAFFFFGACYFIYHYLASGKSRRSKHKAVPSYSIFSTQGRRPQMEDRYCASVICNDKKGMLSVFGVFDGHAGKEAAHYCQQYFLTNFLNLMRTRMGETVDRTYDFDEVDGEMGMVLRVRVSDDINQDIEEIKEILHEVYVGLDQAYLKEAKIYGWRAGTTACCCVVSENFIVAANAGDSRAVLVLENGTALEMSSDHKPNRHDERLRIEEMPGGFISFVGVWRVQGMLATSRAIGDKDLKPYVIPDPEFTSVHLNVNSARSFSRHKSLHARNSQSATSSPLSSNKQILSNRTDPLDGLGDDDDDQLTPLIPLRERAGGGSRFESKPAYLILATDGLWDVLSSQDAADIVMAKHQSAPPLISSPTLSSSSLSSSVSSSSSSSSPSFEGNTDSKKTTGVNGGSNESNHDNLNHNEHSDGGSDGNVSGGGDSNTNHQHYDTHNNNNNNSSSSNGNGGNSNSNIHFGADVLCQRALLKGSTDNVTALVVKLKTH